MSVTRMMMIGLTMLCLGLGLSACGKRGDPVRPSEAATQTN